MTLPDNFSQYDTSINVIGGLIDSNLLSKAIYAYFSKGNLLKSLIYERNEFNLRTEKSRIRVGRAVNNNFLSFLNENHYNFMQNVFKDKIPQKDKELALFWQFALNNRLFREISIDVFIKTYYSGRATISKEDIIGYLKELISHNSDLKNSWSQSTIDTLATKYLNFMSKINFISSGRIKSFNFIRPSKEATVLFLYFAKLFSPNKSNILKNKFLPLSFIPSENVHVQFKDLSKKGYFHLNFNGETLNIELAYSYKEICDVLYN